MGNRIKGKVKRKSIKAALSSSVGSKRKLSRMGKKQKKEHGGLEATFIGRSKCLRMLQVTLKDFRRLCILKGIYPRQPLGRVPGKKKGQTFYHIKDIRAIAHEPILEKFREFRAFMKKVRRAAGRNERDEALRRHATCPTYTISHLVKERYPRFQDGLADIDDALTLTFLFAALPADRGIPSKIAQKAKNLAASWGAYCATTCSITKSFISVKGVYVEASVQNIPVRWVVPHSFTQHLPTDVDYRVMMTFFEFYETLLDFLLFKLYSDIGLRYPVPVKDTGGEVIGGTSAILGANLRALTNAFESSKGSITNVVKESLEQDKKAVGEDENPKEENEKSRKTRELLKSVDSTIKKLEDEDGEEEEEDEEEVDLAGPLKVALDEMAEEHNRAVVPGSKEELDDGALKRKQLFQGLTFFLSREIPRGYLELICLAYGGKVGWEGDNSPIPMEDPSITHHIVDRPKLPNSYESLPKSREYVQPQWILDSANFIIMLPIAKYAVGSQLPPHLSPWVDNEEEGYKPAYLQEIEKLKNGETVDSNDVAVDDDEAVVEEDMAEKEDEVKPDSDTEEEGESSESGEDHDEDESAKKSKAEKKREKEEKEAHELAKTMMSRKATHLYGRMQHGLARKQDKLDELHRRRKEIDGKEKDAVGKTVLKQKVDRLKKERKTVEDEYSKTDGSMKKNKKRRST
eukprot:CAMPEP_0198144474 /NCGR_PEP_ID=MMETSP1443-20131203/16200_1 /TAXON_ID=186043 /ORGANISM="Entomoneis sp., Strain CCMP2396" /LENGTH=687 /DNA_ID=CAMNT_0043807877 /DNA_START=21 /DNA_END=2084 /DNA_ORIENTATION=+